jgi:hypothetical protein
MERQARNVNVEEEEEMTACQEERSPLILHFKSSFPELSLYIAHRALLL